MKKEDELKSKLSTVGAGLLDIVDGDPMATGYNFWPRIYSLISFIEKQTPIRGWCPACNKIVPRAKGWKRKDVKGCVQLVCPECIEVTP